jgi:hypothetical protein
MLLYLPLRLKKKMPRLTPLLKGQLPRSRVATHETLQQPMLCRWLAHKRARERTRNPLANATGMSEKQWE